MIEPTGYTALDLIGFTDKGNFDPNATYVKNDLVHDNNGSIWRVLIDDTRGVTPAEGLNYTIFVRNPTDAAKQIIAPVETNPSTNAHAAGTQIIHHDVLYDVTTAIAARGALIVYPTSGYNIKPAPLVTSQIQALTNNKQNKTLSTPILSQSTVEGALQALNHKTDIIANANFLLMGDSYGPTSGWPAAFSRRINSNTCVDLTEGGRTFVSNDSATSYIGKLTAYVNATSQTVLNSFDYLILLGGIGDSHPGTNSGLNLKIEAFINYAKEHLPNAKIYLGYIGGGLTGYGGSADVGDAVAIQRLKACAIYHSAATAKKQYYVSGIHNVLNNYRWYIGTGQDGLHPLQSSGIGEYIADYLYNFLNNGSADYIISDAGSVTIGNTSNVAIRTFQDNNITEVLIGSFEFTLGSEIGEKGTMSYKICDLPAWVPIWSLDKFTAPLSNFIDGFCELAPITFYIYKHGLYVTSTQRKTSGSWWNIPSGRIIEVPSITIRCATDLILG